MEDYNLYDIAGVSGDNKDDPKKKTTSAPSPNFTTTKDPNVRMGKYGVPITQAQFEFANKNGYAWKDLDAYADYVGSWAHPVTNRDEIPTHPYYRAYGGQPNINGVDVQILAAKNDPKINIILNRNIAGKGEVPMFASDDADTIRKLIANERAISGATQSTPAPTNADMAAAVANVIKK